MKLTIGNYAKQFKTQNYIMSDATALSPHFADTYEFILQPKDSSFKHAAVYIERTPAPLTTKTEVCFKVRISIDTYTNVIYTEDVSLSGLKDKKLFWESVDNILKNRQIK